MKNKILLLVLCLFVLFIKINVSAKCGKGPNYNNCPGLYCNASEKEDCESLGGSGSKCCSWTESSSDKYCCNGVEKDAPVDGQTCGKKTGACKIESTGEIKASQTVQKMSLGDPAVTISGCNGTCNITNNTGGVVTATKDGFSVAKNPLNNKCSQNVKITYTSSSSTILSNGVKIVSNASKSFEFQVIATWANSAEKNKEIWSRNAPSPTSKADANAQGKNVAYVGCKQDDKNKNKWICPEVWKRGCSISVQEFPGCYKEKSTGFYYWGLYGDDSNFSFVSSITDQKDCVSKFECSTKYPGTDPQNTPCNGEGTIKGTYTKKCDTIYEIKCEEKINTKFDGPVLDSSLKETNNAYLYPGTGFKYKFSAVSTMSCTGNFDNNRYAVVEKYIKNYVSTIGGGSSSGSLDEKFYTNALNGLEEIKKSYTDWKLKYDSNATVTIHDTINGGQNREAVTLKDVNGSITKLEPTCGELPNGQTRNFNYVEKNYIEKEMPKAYLKKGKVIYEVGEGIPCANCSYIGKKYFVDDNYGYTDTDKYDYNYVVEASSLGYGGYGSDKTVCTLGLINNKLIYRHIDLNDPFLQKTTPGREIGYNWSNSKYNFTKIINPNVWSEQSMYKSVNLTPDTNESIKSTTKNNANYYVGACTNGEANNADIICRLLRAAQR